MAHGKPSLMLAAVVLLTLSASTHAQRQLQQVAEAAVLEPHTEPTTLGAAALEVPTAPEQPQTEKTPSLNTQTYPDTTAPAVYPAIEYTPWGEVPTGPLGLAAAAPEAGDTSALAAAVAQSMEASPPTRCGTANPTRAQKRATERLARQILRQRDAIGAASVSVPVVDVFFHVVSRGASTDAGNVPQAWIEAQLNVLNAAYTGRVVFRGNGTSRTVNTAWNPLTAGSTAERNMKAATRRGTSASLNFWITTPRDSQGRELLGFAYLPPASLTWDGVVCGPFTLPTGSSLGSPYNLGDTGTHEVGHWLGLLHTFDGGCSSSGTNGGDLVSDTPAERSPTYNCATTRDTCSSLAGRDSVRNFMNYGDDVCMNAFTAGQYTRMVNQWNAFRQGK